MATYKGIQGFSVQTLAADPDNTSWVGSIFYNSTEGVFKTVKPGGISAATWASGGPMNTGRNNTFGTGQTQNGAVCAGGDYAPAISFTETYDGTSWTEVNNLNNGRQDGAAVGTYTSALAITGTPPGPASTTNVEAWDGTNWTAESDVNTAVQQAAGLGTSGAALKAGGSTWGTPAPGNKANTEVWNGSTWTEVNDLPTTDQLKGGGSSTAGFGLGLYAVSPSATVYEWDGTSWSTGTSYNTGRSRVGTSIFGTPTEFIIYGGSETPTIRSTKTEYYNGTSWTEVNDLSIAVATPGTCGTSTDALCFAGNWTSTPALNYNTQEWTVPDIVINTLTTS